MNRMGRVTVEAMGKAFGSDPKDIVACIGPSICRDCYEVGPEVAEAFENAFEPAKHSEILEEKPDGKFLLDLWRANAIVMEEAGILPERIHVTDICTHCNPELLYSHRRTGERRGNLCAFLSLKKG